VWQIFSDFISNNGVFPTLIEWDEDIPEFSVLFGEAKKAQSILDNLGSGNVSAA
jgi:uncharacterized protein (UPF0276 family)